MGLAAGLGGTLMLEGLGVGGFERGMVGALVGTGEGGARGGFVGLKVGRKVGL